MKLPSMMSWIGVRLRGFGGFALVLSFLVFSVASPWLQSSELAEP